MELVLKQAIKNGFIVKNSYSVQSVSIQQSQLLSHQKISGQFICLKLTKPPAIDGLIALPRIKLTQYAFPGFINRFLKEQTKG